MIAIPAAVPVNLNHQGAAVSSGRARLPLPPSSPKRSVAAARSWGDAIRSCRPAPGVTFMPTQRTLVAALCSTISDVGVGRTRQRIDGTATPTSSRPSTAEALRAQQRGSPRSRVDAQWRLDDDQNVSGGARSYRPQRRPKLHALQAVPGAGVIGQSDEVNPMWPAHSSTEVDSGPETPVKPDVAVQQLVGRQEEEKQRQDQEATRPSAPQQPRSSSARKLAPRGVLDLGGTQHPRSTASTGMAEMRRSTVRHIDDILHHPSRTPRKPDTRGLIPDERSQASLVSSSQRLAAARLRREGVYVTGVVQPVLAPSVFCRDQHPRTASTATTASHLSPVAAEKVDHGSSSPATRRPEQRERIGPFEDGASGSQFSISSIVALLRIK